MDWRCTTDPRRSCSCSAQRETVPTVTPCQTTWPSKQQEILHALNPEAMAQLLENTSKGLHLAKSILTRGTHVLHVWTDQLTQPDADDFNAINSVLPGLPAQFRSHTTRGSPTSADCRSTAPCRHHSQFQPLPDPPRLDVAAC